MNLRRTLALISALVLVVTASACSSEDDSAREAAEEFISAFAARDFDAAAGQTTDPAAASAGLRSAWEGLGATGLSARAGRVHIDQDVAEVDVTYDWELSRGRTWEYTTKIALGRNDVGWSVRWRSTAVHPKLGTDQHLQLSDLSPPRATVNESDGSEVMVNGIIGSVFFDAEAAAAEGDVFDSVTRTVATLTPVVPGLRVQTIAEKSTASDEPLFLGRLSGADTERLREQLAIPGVVLREESVLEPRNPGFASPVLARVKDEVGNDIVGTAGWRVAVVNPSGLVADVVSTHRSVPAPAVSLTLSRTVQDAAQRAVNAVQGKQAMTVAIQASTGKILAIAQNPEADGQGLPATTGQFPPGSTFKMVTSAAAMNAEMSNPDALVPCPGEITIGDRTIPNYNGFALGTVPLTQAFAASCNTSFADLASRMGPSDLAHAAAAMGLTAQYTVPGLDVQTGSVPIEPDLVMRTVDGFGQGTVLASPLGMATVAGAAAAGKPPVPQLMNDRETKVEGPRPPLDESVYARLRGMMRAVVTGGTATSIAGQGEVFGKTGEAEAAGGSHAWFAGYRGDIAFATLIVLGGDSTNAVNVTADFLSGVPVDYRP
ncbi:penicillin-binding transpeptidase domain-containing protein [Gordonia zhaorongruii]|uniref:penicillin-binding transpeptidase domain-containing protein n=1 Tax=Gordonia zhaorongruii TaxID=2597659 RepID=UPI001180DC8C|nr:penicillin-binding transpeptidase domain-containing protein [Gordonia zhaorongruii]